MTMYLDIILVENMVMNYIIIYTTGYILKERIKQTRIIFSSLIGSLYTLVMYLNILKLYSNFIMKIILSFVIMYVAFETKTAKKLFKNVLMFYFVSFVFGGCVFALMYFLSPKLALMRNGVFVGTYPLKIAIFGGILSFIVLQISFKIVKSKLSKREMIYEMQIIINNNKINIKALLDTGNMLKDPITNYPVIIVEQEKLHKIIPENMLQNINKFLGGEVCAKNSEYINKELVSKFRIIPFSSIGKSNGILLGIKADSVNIKINEKYEENKNVIIGIYDKTFTKNGNYSAIFGLDILEGGKVNEYIANAKN